MPSSPERDSVISQDAAHLFKIPRVWLSVITVLLTVPWIAVAVVWYTSSRRSDPVASTPSQSPLEAAPKNFTLCKPGPWGVLEKADIIISPPLEFVGETRPDVMDVPWRFPKMSRDEVDRFLKDCGLSDQQRTTLLERVESDPSSSGVKVVPPQEVVSALTPTVRAKLYHFLGSHDANANIVSAFRFSGSEDEWLSPRVPIAVQNVFKSYMYSNGGTLFLADVAAVLASCANEQQQRQALKMMSRNQTIMLKLRVDDAMQIEQLVTYWGRGGRSKDIRPLLESLVSLPGGQSIDIVHLFPAFARQRLYTYAYPSTESNAAGRNCYWTAMNFFNKVPEDRFTNLTEVAKAIEQDYYPIYSEPQFGDLVFFGRSDKEFVHAAVYIADDIVFTKNGSMESRPWMLMPMDRMKEYYPIPAGQLQIKYFRQKNF